MSEECAQGSSAVAEDCQQQQGTGVAPHDADARSVQEVSDDVLRKKLSDLLEQSDLNVTTGVCLF
jgi:hypothetical protein